MLDTQINHILNEVNFNIAIQEIPTVPSDQYRKIVRTDTDAFLGMCKTRYKPISHMDAFGGALKSMSKGGLDFADAEFNIQSYDLGAMAKMEIVFPNYKEMVGNQELKLKYVARNSYNGLWKFQAFFGWLNTVCHNTLVSGQQLAYQANRHTKLFDINASNEKIFNAVKAVQGEAQSYKDWWYTEVKDDDVAQLFTETLCKKDYKSAQYMGDDKETNKKQLGILMNEYNKEKIQIHGKGAYTKGNVKGSLWCAFQSATYWSTHVNKTMTKENYREHIIQNKRQSSVKSMLKSKQWRYLESGTSLGGKSDNTIYNQ